MCDKRTNLQSSHLIVQNFSAILFCVPSVSNISLQPQHIHATLFAIALIPLILATTFAWVSIAPFGNPVVPLV